MAIGDILQSVSVRNIASHVSGLGSYISSYFESTATQPQHKPNREWNDPINKDAKGMFWVYYQNVHGVSRDNATVGQDLQTLAELEVGCLCFAETNLDWNRSYVKYDFLSRQRKVWKHAATIFSSIDMESSLDYMTGGTLTSTVDKWGSRVLTKESNPSGMGRLSSQTLAGRKNSKITIITGYQCMQNSSGDTSVWNQEKIFMRDHQSRQSPHPRKQFIKDLITFINDKRSVNHDIMLNLDANETLGEETQGISKLMRECGLVDLLDMPGIRPDEQLQDTYRQEQIDESTSCWVLNMSIQVSGVVEHWNTMMGLSPTIRDFMSTWTQRYCLAETQTIQLRLPPVDLHPRMRRTKAYLDHLDKYFLDHKICERIDKLIEDAPRMTRTTLK
jgi:hypothetical protein